MHYAADDRARPSLVMWCVCLISLTCLLLMGAVDNSALLGIVVLGLSGLLWLADPLRWNSVFLRYRLLWLIPAANAVSMLTSREPMQTLRIDLELVAIICCTIILARNLGPRAIIEVLSVAITAIVLAGFASGGSELIYGQEDAALHGLFASKNYFAFICGIGVMADLVVATGRLRSVVVRAGGLLGCLMCGALQTAARSVDATIGTFLGLIVIVGVVALSWFPRRSRPFAVMAFCLPAAALVFVAVVVVANVGMDGVLAIVGKNSTLTGRAVLWYHARQLIAQRPILGFGYQAFWRRDFVEAEGMWRVMKVTSRGGFHFHNTYYETLIETGFVGLAALIITFVGMTIAAVKWAYKRASAEAGFFVGILLYLFSRSFLEVDANTGFAIGTVLLTCSLVFSRDMTTSPPVGRGRRVGAGQTSRRAGWVRHNHGLSLPPVPRHGVVRPVLPSADPSENPLTGAG